MAMSVGGAGQTSVRSSPNVVPMIDIMLVLLIIFMIVTPLIAAGFKATLPKGKNLDPRPEGDNEVILGSTSSAGISSTGGRFPRAPWRTSSARSTPRGKRTRSSTSRRTTSSSTARSRMRWRPPGAPASG